MTGTATGTVTSFPVVGKEHLPSLGCGRHRRRVAGAPSSSQVPDLPIYRPPQAATAQASNAMAGH